MQNGQGRDRTGDTSIFSAVLYQLSYLPYGRDYDPYALRMQVSKIASAEAKYSYLVCCNLAVVLENRAIRKVRSGGFFLPFLSKGLKEFHYGRQKCFDRLTGDGR